jgi:hypothetical protein
MTSTKRSSNPTDAYRIPPTTPVEALSSLTVLLSEFATQTWVPSDETPRGQQPVARQHVFGRRRSRHRDQTAMSSPAERILAAFADVSDDARLVIAESLEI